MRRPNDTTLKVIALSIHFQPEAVDKAVVFDAVVHETGFDELGIGPLAGDEAAVFNVGFVKTGLLEISVLPVWLADRGVFDVHLFACHGEGDRFSLVELVMTESWVEKAGVLEQGISPVDVAPTALKDF